MASNVVKNRKWIAQTYKESDARAACQKWVDDHPAATTQAEIQAGLLSVFDRLTADQRARAERTFRQCLRRSAGRLGCGRHQGLDPETRGPRPLFLTGKAAWSDGTRSSDGGQASPGGSPFCRLPLRSGASGAARRVSRSCPETISASDPDAAADIRRVQAECRVEPALPATWAAQCRVTLARTAVRSGSRMNPRQAPSSRRIETQALEVHRATP